VTAEEIGALLWTLTHGGDPSKPYRHMIGRAKNAGAGQERVKALRLSLMPNDSEQRPMTDLESWEKKSDNAEGWTAQGNVSLTPFLRAFDAYMKTHDKNWPQTNDTREFLGACNPAEGAKLRQEFLPMPNDFGRLRRLVKADVQSDPAPVTEANNRLLPAPAVVQVMTPYR
jgi:hypothetical protein